MRFHIVALPHTQVIHEFSGCAFTEKVRRFCIMMHNLGHEVFLYAGEVVDAPVTELITCISEDQRAEAVKSVPHFTQFPFSGPLWDEFNANAIAEIASRIQEKDFICLIGGSAQKPIADAFPAHLAVEFGVGYGGVFAKFRVFESYAWMHSIYAY